MFFIDQSALFYLPVTVFKTGISINVDCSWKEKMIQDYSRTVVTSFGHLWVSR